MWTVKKLVRIAKETPNIEWRPVSQNFDVPCNLNRLTKAGKRKEGVTIYEDLTIHRNDVRLDLCTRMRPQDAARVLGLKE